MNTKELLERVNNKIESMPNPSIDDYKSEWDKAYDSGLRGDELSEAFRKDYVNYESARIQYTYDMEALKELRKELMHKLVIEHAYSLINN